MYPNTLKFLIKWFEQGGCKVDAANAYKNASTDYKYHSSPGKTEIRRGHVRNT